VKTSNKFDFSTNTWDASIYLMPGVSRLANRFGKTYHLSYLRRKLERLSERVPESMQNLEEWLIRVAKLRANRLPGKPSVRDVPNEELIVTLLLLENQDRRGVSLSLLP